MKAELFSSDFIVSIIIFLSILVILGMYYGNLQADIYEKKSEFIARMINKGIYEPFSGLDAYITCKRYKAKARKYQKLAKSPKLFFIPKSSLEDVLKGLAS